MTANDTEIKQLVAELKEEREKFTQSNKDKMKSLCDKLVELGHYPAVTHMGRDPLSMVESYGVDWNVWGQPHFCQHCNADLRDHTHGPPFKREIGIYSMGEDRTVSCECPECKGSVWQLYRNVKKGI